MLILLRRHRLQAVWDHSLETWDSLAGWPLPDRGNDFLSVRDNVRAALTTDVDLMLYGWAQMDEPNSLLVALTRNPGIFFYADGFTLGRPAMRPFCQVCAEERSTERTPHQWLNNMSIGSTQPVEPDNWWHVPHPHPGDRRENCSHLELAGGR